MIVKFTLEEEERTTNIKVVGVGGAGGNAVNRMVEDGVEGGAECTHNCATCKGCH